MSLFPGDYLLFTAGALATVGTLDLIWLLALAFVVTMLADSLNYLIGDRAVRRLLVGRLPFTQPMLPFPVPASILDSIIPSATRPI